MKEMKLNHQNFATWLIFKPLSLLPKLLSTVSLVYPMESDYI